MDQIRDAFRWSVRLSDTAPQKLFGVLGAAVGAMALGWFVLGSPLLGIVGFAIILGATAEFWLGSSFSLDEKGASARTGFSLTQIEWDQVKRLLRDENGVRLSPLETSSTMDAFRGVYLRYGRDNREEIEKALVEFGGHRTALG